MSTMWRETAQRVQDATEGDCGRLELPVEFALLAQCPEGISEDRKISCEQQEVTYSTYSNVIATTRVVVLRHFVVMSGGVDVSKDRK